MKRIPTKKKHSVPVSIPKIFQYDQLLEKNHQSQFIWLTITKSHVCSIEPKNEMNVRMNGLEKHFEKNMQDMKYIIKKLTKKSFNDSGENNQA